MKRAILLTLAAGVATLPALWGVTGNTTFGQSVPAAIPSGASVAPHDDDARTSEATGDNHGRGSGDSPTPITAAATSSADERRGRGSDDATTSPTRGSATSTRTAASGATTSSTGDDKGSGGQTTGDDGHSGKGLGKG